MSLSVINKGFSSVPLHFLTFIFTFFLLIILYFLYPKVDPTIFLIILITGVILLLIPMIDWIYHRNKVNTINEMSKTEFKIKTILNMSKKINDEKDIKEKLVNCFKKNNIEYDILLNLINQETPKELVEISEIYSQSKKISECLSKSIKKT